MDVGLSRKASFANGKKRNVKCGPKQHVIITFSRKKFEYQRFIRNRQIERAKKILEKPGADEYKKAPTMSRDFIKRLLILKAQYEIGL